MNHLLFFVIFLKFTINWTALFSDLAAYNDEISSAEYACYSPIRLKSNV
jgi:hypothetical protein